MDPIEGLHHITAITRNAQHNADFYRNVLGQRLVKKTVNFDVPDTYHLYFADAAGTPGTVLTFFVWTNIKQGTRGNGEAAAVAYSIPRGSTGFWQDYLQGKGVEILPMESRFGEDVISFYDPDGMSVELVASQTSPAIHFWEEGPIPRAHALNSFHSVTLWLDEIESTAELLTRQMGYTLQNREGHRYRFAGKVGSMASTLDILHRPRRPGATLDRAVPGAGSVHHIAFRVPTDASQIEYQSILRMAGLEVTPVTDRNYFRSIYYREPGGVLFEIATEPPGFAIDEPIERLGESLRLPEWFEPNREIIEQNLPPLTLKPLEKARR